MHDEQQLEALMRITGCEQALDSFTPRDKAPTHYLARLSEALTVLTERFGVSPDLPTIQLLCEMESNEPYKLCAFIQSLVTSRNPLMIAMAWRVIGGSRIRSVHMQFDDRESFSLAVTAQRNGGDVEKYVSQDVNDKRLLHQMVLTSSSGKPTAFGFLGLCNFP